MAQPYRLHVLVEEESLGQWSAHVLDFDIVASADTEAGVLELVPGLVATWVEAVRRDGTIPLMRPAEPQCWDRFLRARPSSRPLLIPGGVHLPDLEREFVECDLGIYPKAA